MSLEIGDTTNVIVSAFTSYFQCSQENYTAAQEVLKYDHFYFSKRTLLSCLWLSHRENRITVYTHLMHLLVHFDCLLEQTTHCELFFIRKQPILCLNILQRSQFCVERKIPTEHSESL